MKNFRKVLALILVVATLFSFVAMVSAKDADDYSDYDKVSYAEAVDVLSAIGILDGYPDGTFRPANTIKRSEMAKMIAVLSNAGDDVSDLYASACTFADAKNDWAASYIAYCAQTGIVAGRNATTFDPNGKVTGIETAKMLLCVLGFDAAAQGYVGTNWKTNILRDAKDFGLLDGFAADYDPDKAITREEAAQMMLNALQANIVIGTISGNLVKITNTIYVDKYDDVHISIADAEKEGWVVLTRNNVVISKTLLASIYKGLELNPGFDCYHNPGFVWTYTNSKGTVVFEKFYPSAATYSYTKKATLATDLKEEINSKKYYDVVLYVDGEYQDTYDLTKDNVNEIANAVTGYGVLTNVYVNDYAYKVDGVDCGRVIITVKNTYIGTVTNVSKLQGTFKLNNVNAVAYDNTDYGFKTGDIVLYWLCGESGLDLHDAKLAEPVTGACTRVELATDEFESTTKVDGKTYNYNRNFGTVERFDNIIMTLDEVWASTNNGTTYDLFLDEYGYVMAWRVHNTAPEYVYAYAVENTGVLTPGSININDSRNDKYTNDMVTFDAKYNEDVEINAAAWNAIKAMGHGNRYEKGLLMRYEVIDGVATYSSPADSAIEAGPAAYLDVNGNVHRNSTNSSVAISYGDDNTQYMVRTWNYEQKKFEYNVYTRDQLTVGLAGYKYDSTGAVMATIQYFLDPDTAGTNSAHLDYVFVDALYQRSAQKAFVYGDLEKIICDDLFVNQIFGYSAYPAMINGEKAYLAVTGDDFGDTVLEELHEVPWLYQADLQVIGLVDGKTPVYANMSDLDAYDDAGRRLMYNDGNIDAEGYGSFKVDKDCVVIVIDEATDSYLKLETVADINDYFEELQTNVDEDENGYYTYDAYWLFNDGVQYTQGDREGTVDEIYIIVEDGVYNGNFGGQH